MIAKLTETARQQALSELPNWSLIAGRDAIERKFVFADFDAAFAFMTEVAAEAARTDHHPEWSNVYNRVDIVLTTHDAKGLSRRDIDLAKYIDGIAG